MHAARKETAKASVPCPERQWRLVHVMQGECIVLADPSRALTTVLGSCVAACVRDPASGIGGMNHFLLPVDISDADASLRYGVNAMEALLNQVSAKAAVRRVDLEIKIFGGANVHAGLRAVGHRNASFVEDFLTNEGLRATSGHLRGELPRKVVYHPDSGRVLMRYARTVDAAKLLAKETNVAVHNLAVGSGDVELFA